MDQKMELLWRDYEATSASFRYLAEVRFKLLALLPTVSGAAVGLISNDLEAFRDSPLPRLLVGLLGLTVTLGIVFYDQRNSQLYNALVFRARRLEEVLWPDTGGQFGERPGRELRFLGFIRIWHDRGLALIYGSVLGAWIFPVACGLMWALEVRAGILTVPEIAAGLSVLYGTAMMLEFHRLDASSSKAPQRTEQQMMDPHARMTAPP